MKVKRIRAGLYRVEVDEEVFTVEHRLDVDRQWWVTDDVAFFDPNRGVYPTKRAALESLRAL